MWVAGLECVWHTCTFCIHLHHFAVASCGQWVRILCPLCSGAMWVHQKEILLLNWSMTPWYSCQFVSWWALHHVCMIQLSGSSLLGNRAQSYRLHHLCALPCTSFGWYFELQLVPIGTSGHTLRTSRYKFPIPLGRVAKLLWPWHMPHRVWASTQGWAGYRWCDPLQLHTW